MDIEDYAGILYDKEDIIYILSKIGDGASSIVFLCKKNNNDYAIKLYKNTEAFHSENILNYLPPSKHIVRMISNGKGYIDRGNNLETFELTSNFELDDVTYALYEYIPNGELFNYVIIPNNGFYEEIAKKIFYDISSAIELCHKNGVVHGDIKLENIMLSSDFSVKLIDFGFAKKINDEPTEAYYGTRSYSSPEMNCARGGVCGMKNDIFSLGVLLFALVVGCLPFENATFSDPKYKLIVKNKYDNFWECFSNVNLSESFKDLVSKMLCYDPSERIELCDILSHSWMDKSTFDADEGKYQKEFSRRKEIVDDYFKKKNL